MKKIRKNCLEIVAVLVSAMVAILVHALLPSPGAETNTDAFDGFLVQIFGFPFVASMYFILLYLHIFIVMRSLLKKFQGERMQLGIRYGVAFGLMYLIGMQEVVVEGSPLTTYGKDFIFYQLFMGLGDAMPVVFLCIALAACIGKKEQQKEEKRKNESSKKPILSVLLIAFIFFAQRTVRYYIGYIDSDIKEYPIPVLIWTAVMGLVFGVMYVLLESVHPETGKRRKIIRIVVLIIGINWIWFNCFMGLILKGIFWKMFLRAAIDVVFILFAAMLL